MTLEDAVAYYSEIAKECRQNARIESNDYMDMRDATYEAEQLADWLNELIVLRERIEGLISRRSATDDSISRQAAIDAIRSYYDEFDTSDKSLEERIEDLPPAQQEPKWIPFKTRPLTEEEKEEHSEWDSILDCKLPDDGQQILVSVSVRGHERVQYDEFYTDDGCYLDSGYEIGTEAVAWMPLPKPWEGERNA